MFRNSWNFSKYCNKLQVQSCLNSWNVSFWHYLHILLFQVTLLWTRKGWPSLAAEKEAAAPKGCCLVLMKQQGQACFYWNSIDVLEPYICSIFGSRDCRRQSRLGGVNSNSSSSNSSSIINSSSVEVLSGVVFFSAAERPFRARSAAERRVAR